MKKKIVAAMLASMLVVSLAACGGGDDGSGSTGGDAQKEENNGTEDTNSGAGDNTLTVWTWDPNFNIYAINKAAEIYAANGHDGFTVNVTEVKSDDIEAKITTAVTAGDLSTLRMCS